MKRIIDIFIAALLRMWGPSATIIFAKAFRKIFSPGVCGNIFSPALLRAGFKPKPCVQLEGAMCSFIVPLKGEIELGDYVQNEVFFHGVPPLCATLLEHCTDNSAFIDIGANIGIVSLVMALRIPGTSIFAVEANPKTAVILRRNAEKSQTYFHIVECGFSNRIGIMKMQIVPHDSGSCTLDDQRFQNQRAAHEIAFQKLQIEVPVCPFDDWFTLQNLANGGFDRFLIKVDVEGHELEVLEGMQKFFSEKWPGLLICEVTNSKVAKVREMLSGFGWTERRPCWNTGLSCRPHHTNLVFGRGI